MTVEEEVELLKEIIGNVKISHSWMLVDTRARHDSGSNPGNYSDELKHAIAVQEILEKF